MGEFKCILSYPFDVCFLVKTHTQFFCMLHPNLGENGLEMFCNLDKSYYIERKEGLDLD